MDNASCGGTFLSKNEDEAWKLFEVLSENSIHRASVSRSVSPASSSAPKRLDNLWASLKG